MDYRLIKGENKMGGRGASGKKRGSGGAAGNKSVSGSAASSTGIDRIEKQISVTERNIAEIKGKLDDLNNEIPSLVRAKNYNQIKINNRKGEELIKKKRAMEKELKALYREGKALSID